MQAVQVLPLVVKYPPLALSTTVTLVLLNLADPTTPHVALMGSVMVLTEYEGSEKDANGSMLYLVDPSNTGSMAKPPKRCSKPGNPSNCLTTLILLVGWS